MAVLFGQQGKAGLFSDEILYLNYTYTFLIRFRYSTEEIVKEKSKSNLASFGRNSLNVKTKRGKITLSSGMSADPKEADGFY